MDSRIRGGLRPAAHHPYLTTSHTAPKITEHHRQQGRQLRHAHHQNTTQKSANPLISKQTGGSRLSVNTVQLVCLDRVFGEFRWLRPVGVVEAFRGPFEDLAFDDAGV